MGEWVMVTIIGDYIGVLWGSIPPFPTKHQTVLVNALVTTHDRARAERRPRSSPRERLLIEKPGN